MKRFERHEVCESKKDVARGLKRLKDEYSFKQFQAMAFTLTGYVVKPHPDKCILSIHKGLCIKKTEKPFIKDTYEWGVCGTYMKKPVESIKYKGNFTYGLLKKIVNTTKTIKGDK